jgi:predicted transcriptional regulator
MPADVESVAHIVAAYLQNNQVPAGEVAGLITAVGSALDRLNQPAPEPAPAPTPAVNPKRSVFPDYIVSLEDGKRYKSLKRHLMSRYGMTPPQYREKWGLPADYPMVAPNYASARSELAKKLGLGRKRREDDAELVGASDGGANGGSAVTGQGGAKAAAAQPADDTPKAPAKRRGRPAAAKAENNGAEAAQPARRGRKKANA